MKRIGLVLLIWLALLQAGAASAAHAWGRQGCPRPGAGPRPLHACFKPGSIWLVPLG